MSEPRAQCCFAYLRGIGLIDGRQYRRAIASPAGQALAASPTLVEPLVWLMREQGLSADALADAYDTLELASDRDMLDQALERVELFCIAACAVWVDLLVQEGVLGADQRERALDTLGFERPIAYPGEVLFLLVQGGVLTREAVIGTRYVVGSARRDAIVDHAEVLLDGERMRAQSVPSAPLKWPWFWLFVMVCGPAILAIGIGRIMRAF